MTISLSLGNKKAITAVTMLSKQICWITPTLVQKKLRNSFLALIRKKEQPVKKATSYNLADVYLRNSIPTYTKLIMTSNLRGKCESIPPLISDGHTPQLGSGMPLNLMDILPRFMKWLSPLLLSK